MSIHISSNMSQLKFGYCCLFLLLLYHLCLVHGFSSQDGWSQVGGVINGYGVTIVQSADAGSKNPKRRGGFHCPGGHFCSGHGVCRWWHECSCAPGWTGPDCSLRLCPYAVGWAGKPYQEGLAHLSMECANNGLCNRNLGVCECFPGFGGNACQRTTCQNNCNGRGSCLSINAINDIFHQRLGSDTNYLNWDKESTTACVCDQGYSGASCEIALCPKGDDPLTPKTGNFKIQIQTRSNQILESGYWRMKFNGQSFVFPAGAASWDGTACTNSFKKLRSVYLVVCTRDSVDTLVGGGVYSITFYSFASINYDNNIFSNDGKLSASSFICEPLTIPSTHGAICLVSVTTEEAKVLGELKQCSNRGVCNYFSGACDCFPNFVSPNCGQYQPPITLTKKSFTDTTKVISTNAAYTANTVRLTTSVAPLGTFYYIRITMLQRDVFTIDSNGNVEMHFGGLNLQNPPSVVKVYVGGVKVGVENFVSSTDGLVVKSGGLRMVTTSTENSIDGPVSVTGGLVVTGGITVYNGGLVSGNKLFVYGAGLRLSGGINTKAGGMTISQGGIVVAAGGVTVATGGLVVTRKGMTIANNGLSLTGGLTLNAPAVGYQVNGGTTIFTGGMHVNGYFQVAGAGLSVSNGLTIHNSGLLIPTGMTINSGGLVVTGGMTNFNAGVIVSGGLTVSTTGVSFAGVRVTGGLTLFNSGLRVSGGLSLLQGGLVLSGGLTIQTFGLLVTGGVTVKTGGILITAGGLILKDSGLRATRGITINDAGVNIAQSLTVTDGGLYNNGYLTVTAGGLKITGGLSINHGSLFISNGLTVGSGGIYSGGNSANILIQNAGVKVTGGMTINSGGLNLLGTMSVLEGGGVYVQAGATVDGPVVITAGGMTIQNGGLIVTGGVTNNANGLSLSLGSLTVSNTGIKSAGPILVENSGVIVTDGMTVATNGFYTQMDMVVYGAGVIVTGGFTVGNAGIYASGGVTINLDGLVVSGGLSLYNTGLNIEGASIINAGGLVVDGGGATVLASGVAVTGGVTVMNRGVVVEVAGMTVDSGGIRVVHTTTIHDKGVYITGGLTVSSVGLVVTGGSTFFDSGLSMSGGMTIHEGGLMVTGGTTVGTGGVSITGGLTVANVGLYMDSSLLVKNAGVGVVGGATIISGGLYLPDTAQVMTDGLRGSSLSLMAGTLSVTGGMSIRSRGIYINQDLLSKGDSAIGGRLNVMSPKGLYVASGFDVRLGGFQQNAHVGMTINSGGLVVSDTGATIYGIIMLQSTPVVYSDERLKRNISLISNSLDKLRRIRGVYFHWKEPERLPSDIIHSSPPSSLVHIEVQESSSSEASESYSLLDAANSNSSSGSSSSGGSFISISNSNNNRVDGSNDNNNNNNNNSSINNSGSSGISKRVKEELSRRHVGVIAQDVHAAAPEAVFSMEGGKYLGVQYDSLVPLLIEGAKEIRRRVIGRRRDKSDSSSAQCAQALAELGGHSGFFLAEEPSLWSRISRAEKNQQELLDILDKLQRSSSRQR